MTSLPTSIKDVIWVQTGFLGDIVLNSGAFEILRRQKPEIRQHLITTEIGEAALAGHPALKSIHVFRKKGFLLRTKAIKKAIDAQVAEKETVLLQSHRSFRSSALGRRLGFPRITFQESAMIRGAYVVPRVAVFHEAVRDTLLLGPLGIDRRAIVKARPFLTALPVGPSHWQEFFDRPGPTILVAPGSVWGTKRWPSESYRQLLQMVFDETPAKIIFMGSSAERAIVSSILEGYRDNERCLDLTGETTLRDLRCLYPRSDLLVCNDSSAIHFASAFSVPTVAIFGATTASMGFAPLAPHSTVCEVDSLPCRPCSDHGPKTCPLGHFRCMREVSVQQVFSALKDTLKKSALAPH